MTGMAICGANAPVDPAIRRETAQNSAFATSRFVCGAMNGTLNSAGGCSSKLPTALCQHRYPSPCRSVFTQDRPASLFWDALSAALRARVNLLLVMIGQCAIYEGTNKTNKGNFLCLRKQRFWRSLQHWHLAHAQASTLTVSARWSAPQVAHWPQAPRATTPPPVHLQVRPPARCATTSTSAAKPSRTAQVGHPTGLHQPRQTLALAQPRPDDDTLPYSFIHRGGSSCAVSHNQPSSSALQHLPPVRRPWSRLSQWKPQRPQWHPWKPKHHPLSALSAMTAAPAWPLAANAPQPSKFHMNRRPVLDRRGGGFFVQRT